MNRQLPRPASSSAATRRSSPRSSARPGRSSRLPTSPRSAQPIDFARDQLLHARRHAARPDGLAARGAPGAASAERPHRDGLGGLSRRPRRDAAPGCASATARCRSTSPRTAPRSRIPPRAERRASTIRCASTTCATTCGPRARALRGRRRPARLLRLVAPRQLRVVPRLRPSASASCTSTTTTQRRTPKDSARFYAEVIADARRVARDLKARGSGDHNAYPAPARAGRGQDAESASPGERGAVELDARRAAALDRDLPAWRRARAAPSRARSQSGGRHGIDAQAVPLRPHAEDPLRRRCGAARPRSRCTRSSRRGRGAASRARRRCRAGRTARPSSGRGPCSSGSSRRAGAPTSSRVLHLRGGGDRPGRGVRVDAAVLAQPGRVAGDVADRSSGGRRRRARAAARPASVTRCSRTASRQRGGAIRRRDVVEDRPGLRR